jgi:hypothetical protein
MDSGPCAESRSRRSEVIADGSSIGKLESSLRKTVLDVDVDDLGI